MKTRILLLVLVLLTLPCYGQLSNEQKLLYKQKVNAYENMKSTGVGLSTMGFIMSGIGLYLVVDNGDDSENVKRAANQLWGATFLSCGITAVIAGYVLNTNGERKSIEYQQRLKLGVNYSKDLKGIMLVYKF